MTPGLNYMIVLVLGFTLGALAGLHSGYNQGYIDALRMRKPQWWRFWDYE